MSWWSGLVPGESVCRSRNLVQADFPDVCRFKTQKYSQIPGPESKPNKTLSHHLMGEFIFLFSF
jgi:hypothetical protein